MTAEQFGPKYPNIPGLRKFQHQAAPDVHEYGKAVLSGIKKLQAREAARGSNSSPCGSASGSTANTGVKILADIRRRQASGR